MDIIQAYLKHYGAAQLPSLEQALDSSCAAEIGGVARAAAPFFAALLLRHYQRDILFLTSSNREAEALYEESSLFLEEQDCLFFPAYENLPYSEGGIHPQSIAQRVRTLDQIRNKTGPKLLFSTGRAFLQRLPQAARLYSAVIHLKEKQEYNPRKLTEDLIRLGYKRVERVEKPGELCQKGAVFDIYPLNSRHAVRIDYFDDEIESIVFFDAESQRSLPDAAKQCSILPCGELVLDLKESQKLRDMLLYAGRQKNNLKQKLPLWALKENAADLPRLSQLSCPGLEYLFLLVIAGSALVDYFDTAPLIFLYPGLEVLESFHRTKREFRTLYQKKKDEQFCLAPETLLHHCEEKTDHRLIPIHPYGELSQHILDNSSIQAKNATELRRQLQALLREEKQVIVLSSAHSAQLHRMASFFQIEKKLQCHSFSEIQLQSKTRSPALYLLKTSQAEGFSLPALNFYFITDNELFGRSYRRKTRAKRSESRALESFLDIKEGSYVVHLTHGIGRFLGLERVSSMGVERDCLLLEYAGEDRLYVPLDQISLVQEYIAPVEKVRLDSLGKASFKKVKEQVRAKVKELAKELLRLQAIRTSAKGHAFPKDTIWQAEFEAAFPYEESPDQLRAIEAVKQDMEKEIPMDRLICGDVGYGKTEVAIRAVFKCAVAGRQAIFLAPTTILAFQHYQTLKERFANYPITVDWISRFRTAKEIKQIKELLRKGEVDLVVGTHALLASDVTIKNFGLLIVDEEQRFGVSHKEAIKRMRNLVDVLSLSATPIPRTLHMSLVGIRELSVIETPPQERLPVQTYVMEAQDSIIKESVLREIRRGGQIFYLHNRVATIERAAARLFTLFPELKLAVLHGKMAEEEIEEILLRFQQGYFDILLTTSIIENGIDIANANTLLVDSPELFGLSQLYQIRGRVGRSDKQAYAYFLYRDKKLLSQKVQKRLNTLLEYQDLGSGFKVAMRDLEIRGAGNVLGAEQSGHIIKVGYDLYLRLLKESVQQLNHESLPSQQRCMVQLQRDMYLPESYIKDVRQRMEFYKRFEGAQDEQELDALVQEMEERFGLFDEAARSFVEIERLRVLAQEAGFVSIQQSTNTKVELHGGAKLAIDSQRLVEALSNNASLTIQKVQNSHTLYYQAKEAENLTQELSLLFKKLLRSEIRRERAQAKLPAPSAVALF